MLKRIFICVTVALSGLLIYDLNTQPALAFTSGSPGGRTGSPSDGGATCRTCHSGGTPGQKPGLITSTIPASGYVPGETYTITASISEAGRSKFGFELECENTSKVNKGTFVITNTSSTASVQSGKAVTHKSTSGTWSFNWIAPEKGTGQVTFYGAFNASNSSGGDSGDNIYVSTLAVSEQVTGIADYIFSQSLTVYPNPASEYIMVVNDKAVPAIYIVMNSNGSQVMSVEGTQAEERIDIQQLPAGVYSLLVKAQDKTGVKRFVKF